MSVLSAKRRRHLPILAAEERTKRANRYTAIILVFLYNLAGFLDIFSTQLAIVIGAGEEANPIIRLAMEQLQWAYGWIVLKLFFQVIVSAMLLWFPHALVMAFMMFGVLITGGVAIQNLSIAGLL